MSLPDETFREGPPPQRLENAASGEKKEKSSPGILIPLTLAIGVAVNCLVTRDNSNEVAKLRNENEELKKKVEKLEELPDKLLKMEFKQFNDVIGLHEQQHKILKLMEKQMPVLEPLVDLQPEKKKN